MSFEFLNYVWIAAALLAFSSLLFFNIKAPYGRHSNDSWGRMISNKWGWFLMELPALIVMPVISIMGPSEKNEVSYILISIWVIHYANRTLIFPFQLNTNNKKMPLIIVFSAIIFNAMNGFLNGYALGYMDLDLIDASSYHVIIGSLIFVSGMAINRWADKALIRLRENKQGYQIPRGGLFEYISCPNHFGEIVEWIGFALIAWNLPALTFAIWTFCNLSPRSRNHHIWYQQHFKDYPKNRRAVIPYIF